jgi:hypothetical protein
MSRSADAQTWSQFVGGLRYLADCLATYSDIPVPAYGHLINVNVNTPEEGGCFQVRKAARILGVPVSDQTSSGGHYYAEKTFGCITFRIVSIPQACMARHRALYSYDGCVQPSQTDGL